MTQGNFVKCSLCLEQLFDWSKRHEVMIDGHAELACTACYRYYEFDGLAARAAEQAAHIAELEAKNEALEAKVKEMAELLRYVVNGPGVLDVTQVEEWLRANGYGEEGE